MGQIQKGEGLQPALPQVLLQSSEGICAKPHGIPLISRMLGPQHIDYMWPCSPLLPGSVTNEEAWKHGRLLVVGTQQYIIELNPPIVDKVFPHDDTTNLAKHNSCYTSLGNDFAMCLVVKRTQICLLQRMCLTVLPVFEPAMGQLTKGWQPAGAG